MAEIWHEVWIGAPAERVFDALTTKAGLDRWWGPVIGAQARVGYVVEFDHGLGENLRMEIVELEPNRLVVWRCISVFDDPSNPASEWFGQTLRFEVAPRGEVALLGATQDVTVLTFRNAGWPSTSRWCGFCNAAWGETLGVKLKSSCETPAA
jgi:uncharacterized protein YndB with AHSA1/START domain